MMSKKMILIAIVIFVLAGAATFGVLSVMKGIGSTSDAESARGVKPTDDYVFNAINDLKGLPIFTKKPSASNGWDEKSSLSDATFQAIRFENKNSCVLEIKSLQTTITTKTDTDLMLSKQHASRVALSEQGELSDDYILQLSSTRGNTDFYTAVYTPKIQLTQSTGTTPTTQGGSVTLSEPYTTYIAVRSINSPIVSGSSQSTNTDGIVKAFDTIATVVMTYTCSSSAFNVDEAVKMIKQVTIDFDNTQKIEAAKSGK